MTPPTSSPSPIASYGPTSAGSVFALPEPPSTPPIWHLVYASSPRRDLITSVAQRVSTLFVSGLAGRLLTNANVQSGQQRGFRHPIYKITNSNDDEQENTAPTKQIDNYLKRRGVFELLETDLVVGGFVCNKSPEGVHIQIEKIFKIEEVNQPVKKSKKIVETVFDDLRELQIEGLCPIGELTEFSNHDFTPSELLDQIPLGSQIKALVISVDCLTDVIYFSLNGSRLSARQSHHHPLGVISANDCMIPPSSPYLQWRKSTWFNHRYTSRYIRAWDAGSTDGSSLGSADAGSTDGSTHGTVELDPTDGTSLGWYNLPSQSIQDRSSSKSPLHQSLSSHLPMPTFVERLKGHPLFKNPHGMAIMSKAFGITDYGSLMPPCQCDPADIHYNLRAAQNIAWAQKSVSRGLEYLRQNRLSDAIQYFTHAVNVEPQFTDAYVNRGITFIQLNQIDSAVKDLQHALELHPDHPEATTHLKAAQQKKRPPKSKTISDSDDADDPSERQETKRRKVDAAI